MNLRRPELLRALARDHALGTLTGAARRRFERLLRDDPAARQALAEWQASLAVLADEVPRIEPSPMLWQRLQQRLFAPPAPARPWWQRWFGVPAGALAGALAGVLLTTTLLQQNPAWIGHEAVQDALPQSYVGLLSDAAGKPTVLASSRRHGQVLTVKLLQPIAPPPGSVARLWALPRDGSAAVHLGEVPQRGSAQLALAASSEKLFFTVDRLGVSFEPAGPPPAQPTLPFAIAGPCVKLW